MDIPVVIELFNGRMPDEAFTRLIIEQAIFVIKEGEKQKAKRGKDFINGIALAEIKGSYLSFVYYIDEKAELPKAVSVKELTTDEWLDAINKEQEKAKVDPDVECGWL